MTNSWSISVILFLSLFTCTSSTQAYLSSYVYGTFSNPSGVTEELCINYQQFKTQRLPDQTTYRVKFWQDANRNTSLCGSSSGSKSGGIIPVDYRQTMHGFCGQTQGVGYVTQMEALVTKSGANATLFLMRRGYDVTLYQHEYYLRSTRDYLFADFYDRDLRNITAPIFYMYDGVLEEVTKRLGNDLSVTISRPDDFFIDYAVVAIWCLAMICIGIGGYWSGQQRHMLHREEKKTERRRRKRRERRAKKMAALAEQVAREQRNGGGVAVEASDVGLQNDALEVHRKKKKPTADPLSVTSAAALVVLVGSIVTVPNPTLLILGWFFRSVKVWGFLIMFVFGSAAALFECLSALYTLCCRPCGGQCKVCFSVGDILKSMCGKEVSANSCLHKRPAWASVILAILSILTSVTWCIFRNHVYAFILQDLLSTCFCINVIKTVRVPNLKYLTFLLCTLLVYDLFMVFVTPYITPDSCSIMVKVATGGGCTSDPNGVPTPPIDSTVTEDLPVLFRVPRMGDAMMPCYDMSVEVEYRPMILGMGDVILPGLLIGFCFGVDRVWGIPSRIYGIVAAISYGIGLIITFIALFAMSTAQPALIYLVPAVLISTILLAFLRGEFLSIWSGESPRDKVKRLARETTFADATTNPESQETDGDSETEETTGDLGEISESDSGGEEPSQSYGALRNQSQS